MNISLRHRPSARSGFKLIILCHIWRKSERQLRSRVGGCGTKKYNFKCDFKSLRRSVVIELWWNKHLENRRDWFKSRIDTQFYIKSTRMSNNQQNHNGGTSSSPSQNQQSQNQGKWMTQAEYLKYKQDDSNSNNYYEFSKEPTIHPGFLPFNMFRKLTNKHLTSRNFTLSGMGWKICIRPKQYVHQAEPQCIEHQRLLRI